MIRKITAIVFCLLFVTSLAHAHPPTLIDIKYDPVTKQVVATIYHQTSNTQRHFIDKVTTKINDSAPGIKRFSFQKTAREQTVIFVIPGLKSGDMVVLEAYCNKGRRLAQQIRAE
jgi:hypothetical protein